MTNEDYLKITLNGFLLNAGVVGLNNILEFAEAEKGEDCDYYYEGQNFYLSKDYVLNNDLADLFVKTMVEKFGEQSRYEKVIRKKRYLLQKYEDLAEDDKKTEKEIAAIFSEFAAMLQKNSFKAGYQILSDYHGVKEPIEELADEFKKEKDMRAKKEKYLNLMEILERPEVKEVLIFKELMYSKINMFWENASFLLTSNTKKDITECYRDEFILPLTEMIEFEKSGKPKKKRCIDCGELVQKTYSMSFMNDMNDDTNRKKSYYWYQKPDAFLCPLCRFIYSLVPLGFEFIGNDAVFVNNDSNVESLIKIMSSFSQKDGEGEDAKSKRFRVYNLFTEQKIEKVKERVNNIQVVFREKNSEKYHFNTLDKNVISMFDSCKSELAYIKNIFIKNGDDYINVYEETVENIVNRRNQYNLINQLIRLSLNENGKAGYIKNILMIQIKAKGGNDMESNSMNRLYAAKKCGEEMRKSLTADVGIKDKDNKLRGFVYRLLNAISTGNTKQFLNLVIRAYSSCGKAVPNIFINCFASDDEFKEIGYSYVLGLKSEEYKKDEEKGKVENNG